MGRPRLLDRTRRRRRSARGFTLLEMLITLAVTVIGLTGLLSLHVVTTKGNAITSRSGEGVAIAEATVEEIRNLTLPALFTELGVSALPVDVNLDTVAGRAGVTFNRRVQVTELTAVSTNLVKIRVEVSWTDAGAAPGAEGGIHDHRVSLELIRTASESL
ncbi:MAG: prepilin-type N-terminal cleavage/methylation domain-containing protein [Kofleriaceae bacterium]|nr:prepilin-type N-terminal cleavage/methylation domain-containing protein [Kofleriaceae bacterium]MCL4226653.1 prepilin-type N-terminal cleavage/methylation domain-containing protein [Myxococcales bacterium]